MELFNLSGKRALITGSTKGLPISSLQKALILKVSIRPSEVWFQGFKLCTTLVTFRAFLLFLNLTGNWFSVGRVQQST